MAELVLKVSEEKYEASLEQLRKQVERLNELKDQLESKKSQLGEGLKETLGQKTSEMLEANLRNVNRSIEKTNAAIDQIQTYLDNMRQKETALNNSIDVVTEEARQLFD